MQYGIMEIWELKNENAVCRYGNYFNLSLKTFPLTKLKKVEK